VSIEADEAYVIGKRGQYTPVGAYLAGDEIIKIALQHGVQMIHPGMVTVIFCERIFLILSQDTAFFPKMRVSPGMSRKLDSLCVGPGDR
jgi:biotin carboxylase